MIKWVQLLDGSYVQASHITRLHITEDITKKECFDIRASIVGPSHPFILARYESRDDAQSVLDNLVRDLESRGRRSTISQEYKPERLAPMEP